MSEIRTLPIDQQRINELELISSGLFREPITILFHITDGFHLAITQSSEGGHSLVHSSIDMSRMVALESPYYLTGSLRQPPIYYWSWRAISLGNSAAIMRLDLNSYRLIKTLDDLYQLQLPVHQRLAVEDLVSSLLGHYSSKENGAAK